MSKILGEGYVRKTGRTCVIQEKVHNRIVDLPESAFRLNYEKKFYDPEHGDHLIFSAQLQNGRYLALTAIRPMDLLTTYGTLSLLDEQLKFGHVSINGKTAKCFVPFSTRTTNGLCWYGQGAYIDKAYHVLMFRQEESHGCKYVAWAIYDDNRKIANLPPAHLDVHNVTPMKKLGTTNAIQRQSDHQSVEFVQQQFGVIYDVSESFVVSVTSPTSQNVEFASGLFESWMKPGRFMSFDGRRVSDVKTSKLMGSNPRDAGAVYPIRKMSPLTMTVSAVFNKVSHGKAGWAWNDHVGRIYVPWNSTDRHMSASKPLPFTPVHLDIAYNGKHDDIPWVACGASLCEEHEYDQVVDDNSAMLKTEDNWKIQSIVDGPDNPSIFLTKLDDQGRKRCAFAKVIDLNSGNIPATGTLVRVTYYVQERHGRHANRCVLVTTMDKVESLPKSHLVHNGSGRKQYPDSYEAPTPKKSVVVEAPVQRVQAAPLPTKNCWNMKNLGSPKSQARTTEFPSVTGEQDEEDVFVGEEDIAQNEQTITLTTNSVPPPPGLGAPPGLPAPPGLSLAPVTKGVYYEDEFASLLPVNQFSSSTNGIRSGSVWSGTPVEAKPDEAPSFFSQDSFLNTAFGPVDTAYTSVTDNNNLFLSQLTASISQPSTSSVVNSGPISDLRNTQSEASSPGLKSDVNEPAEEQTNCWTSLGVTSDNANSYCGSFSFGFPHMDLPIYQKMLPNNNDIFSSTPIIESELEQAPSSTDTNGDSCTCGSEQLIWDLWQNPLFKAAFSSSDPETFKRVQAKLQTFTTVHRH